MYADPASTRTAALAVVGNPARGYDAGMTQSGPSWQGKITFIGTATLLIECQGLRVLTDPNFLHRGERAWLGHGLISKRLTEPALQPSDLPNLDAIVLSHLHGDHWDRRARRGLDSTTKIITTPHAAKRLPRWHGFHNVVGLDTWQHASVTRGETTMTVTSTPGAHALGLLGKVLPPVMGSVLTFSGPGRRALHLWLSGDTLVIPALAEIRTRYPHLDLGVLHLGGTRILGAMVTMDAAQGIEALKLVTPQHALPVHNDDYGVFKSPLADFTAAIDASELTTKVHYLQPGGSLPLSELT